MTETTTSKVEKWAYPLKVGGAQATDPQQYYAALAKAKDGYYPLGANGLWHGGVHFDESTGLVADLTEVQCIADGEVVAYRIDETYPKSDYGSTQAVYSTGFVLIKHRLEVPTPPARAPAAGAQPAVAAPAPSLTFFSLYMHLLDWEGYSANPSLARPPFWSGGSWQVKATADDKILGLRVRQDRRGKPGYTTVLSVLPRGTLVETGEEENGWLKVVSITPADPNVPAGSGWVFKREMTASATPNSYVIGTDAKDEMNPPRKGLAVHAAANQTSATTAILPAGTEVKIGNDGAWGKYQKLLEIVSGNAVPELTTSNGILGYIWEGLLETKSEPAAKNTVHLLERPFPVKAGSVIGHVGKYQNHDDAAPKNLLHLEVFSCEDVKAFTELSKSKARALPGSGKTLVKIPKDTPLITHVEGMSAENPPKVSDPFKKVGYEFVIPVGTLEALPAEKKIKVAVVMGGVTTYTYWWRIDGLLGDAEGNGIDGWFAEPDTALSRHSPYEWEGFDFIEESVSNIDHLASYLNELNQLDDVEKETFVPKASASTNGPVKERLYSIVDADKNGRLTLAEMRAAMAKPWFALPISQLVTKYESEWFYKAEKWDALDELMGHTAEQPNAGWVAEKKRIEKLSWWKVVAETEGLSADGLISHTHSISLIGAFLWKKRCACNAQVKVTRWKTHYGPIVWGAGKLGDAAQWESMESAGKVTAFEKKIISSMCENEGKINAVQSYDSEILTAGAMQKTINPAGAGELPIQVNRFKSLYPDEYVELFENQGWHVDVSSAVVKMYYQDPEFSSGEKLEGDQLKNKLRTGCGEATYGRVVQCKPVSVFSCAIGSPSYVELQISDFIVRLREVLLLSPNTYGFTIGELFLSALGRTAALDESVNRPSNVVVNLKKALDKFFLQNPNVSKDVSTWGSNHAAYELKIADLYGPGRVGMTEPSDRYNKLKGALNA